MAANETSPMTTTNQVMTNAAGAPTVVDPVPAHPLASGPALDPARTPASPSSAVPRGALDEGQLGVGIEGEETVWEARYALRNFVGRFTARILLTIAWISLAVYTWGYTESNSLSLFTSLGGVALVAIWLVLIYRVILARYGHYYRLTTRRLFVSTGLWRRRRDMLELLRIDDVYTRQTLLERWLSLGTVVVDSSDRNVPTFFVTGVENPKEVMDLIWHHARAERDRRSVKVEEI